MIIQAVPCVFHKRLTSTEGRHRFMDALQVLKDEYDGGSDCSFNAFYIQPLLASIACRGIL